MTIKRKSKHIEGFLTPEEFEKKYHISQSTQGKMRMAMNRRIGYVKIGARVYYPESEVQKFLEKNLQKAEV